MTIASLILCFFAFSHQSNAELRTEGCEYSGVLMDASSEGEASLNKLSNDFTGEKICRHKNGTIFTRQMYKSGVLSGLSEKRNKKGELVEQTEMKDGKRHGHSKRFDRITGKLQKELVFDQDKVQLERTYHRKTGKLEAIKAFQKDGKRGSSLIFNRWGKLSQLNCYDLSADVIDQKYCGREGQSPPVEIYDRHQDRLYAIESYKELKLNGERKVFSENGKTLISEVYVMGKKVSAKTSLPSGQVEEKIDDNGVSNKKIFYASGKIESETLSKAGQVTDQKRHYENGKMKSHLSVVEGLTSMKTYYDNGQMECSYSFRAWMSYEGPFICYLEDGKLRFSENYSNGNLDGEQVYESYQSRRETKKVVYKAGIKISQKRFDAQNVQISFDQFEPDGSKKLN